MSDWLDDRAALGRSREASLTAAVAWRASEPHRALAARFDALDPADVEVVAASAAGLLADTGWVTALIAPLVAALRADPAFEPPVKVHRDALRIGMGLFDHPAVTIGLTILSADAVAATPEPRTIVFPGRLAMVRYHRAGGARWRRWQAEPVTADFTAATAAPCRPLPDRILTDGLVARQDGRIQGGFFTDPKGDVTTLTATVRRAAAPLMRAYATDTGALVRAATLDEAASRTTMLLTLLRLSGRHDAAEAFAGATRAAAFHVRWAAMREWLALDVAAALPRLAEMAASDPHEEVRAAARATLLVAEERLAA